MGLATLANSSCHHKSESVRAFGYKPVNSIFTKGIGVE